MKLLLSWLNDYVKVDDIEPAALADRLLNIGFEVEQIIDIGGGIDRVVAGKILDVKPHQDADRLSVCLVDVKERILTVVTGADNINTGDIVPVALDGASLPGGKKITAGSLRGVLSEGMLCSGAELGADDSVFEGAGADGILILPAETAAGRDVREILGLNEVVFDVAVTANRPDCQSVYGLAREVGAALGRKVKPLNLKYTARAADKTVAINIEDIGLCPRYTARIIDGVKIAPSPLWLRRRLRFSGLKPINNAVDITNYVLLEVGQPLHAFDLRSVEGGITVRRAKSNEKITALDGAKYELADNMLVIADDVKPLAIAGVMGGEFSGVNPDTTCVLLEAATFARGSVRLTSRTLGLRSDSSARYEKGVDYASVDTGRERALALFYQLKAGKITDYKGGAGIDPPAQRVIETSVFDINRVLGMKIKAADAVKILRALEFGVKQNGDALKCAAPAYREDVDNFTDLAEEVIRFYGYDKMNPTLPFIAEPLASGYEPRLKKIDALKDFLVARGLSEAVSYSFINPKIHDKLLLPQADPLRGAIRVLNPLSEEFSVMRTQLSGSMLDIVRLNASRQNTPLRLFEVAKTYKSAELPPKCLPRENETLCAALAGGGADFYALKALAGGVLQFFGADCALKYGSKSWLHPGISADVIFCGAVVGSFGKIHPLAAKSFDVPSDTLIAEIDLEYLLASKKPVAVFKPLPKFPAVERDLAVTVERGVAVGELIDAVRRAGGETVEDVKLFDVYEGEQIAAGSKSVALSVKLRSADSTLDESGVSGVMNKIVGALGAEFNARLRT
ncbi:MAG: phenylalanine--tRNA ligase subunit beta [Clostridiales bacterium]|jgi:phenylalanyl-tRNA synthetase beta chain|nr:phenylalanine--tRNA ligase subunit beta [Clostridiales bacterium]